jgi:gamma-glutamylcyclotransferase (GGCT)/AIG2-like uncharacterized protein YtfP
MLYFAYGSNLNLSQMQRRCPGAEPLDKLMLPNTRLVFRGVADVITEEGAVCPGGIWRITPECERALDRYEGYDPDHPERGMYRKEYVEVDGLPDGETTVMVYAMNSTGIMPPSEGYFQGIVQGYRDFGLKQTELRRALKHAHDEKHLSHIERKRLRRNGRPAFAPRPQPKPEAKAKPAKAKPARRDPQANVKPEQRRRKIMNLSDWLADPNSRW